MTTATCVHRFTLPSPEDVVDGWSTDYCARGCGELRRHQHRFTVPEWHRQRANFSMRTYLTRGGG